MVRTPPPLLTLLTQGQTLRSVLFLCAPCDCTKNVADCSKLVATPRGKDGQAVAALECSAMASIYQRGKVWWIHYLIGG